MFTVKAVVEGNSPDSGHSEIMMATLVTVRGREKVHPAHHPDGSPYVAAQFQVDVEGDFGRRIINVGSDPFSHYQAIYVMNDKGSTVEVIRACIPPSSHEDSPVTAKSLAA